MFVPVIGLVGGVGSGKSTLANWLGARRNLIVINGDETGHTVLKQQSVKDEIQERFGAGVFGPNGEINRAALGRIVFGSAADCKSARTGLERIVHPRIRASFVQQIDQARESGSVQAILLDAAVLFDAGWDDLCDAVVFVETSEQKRWHRVEQQRHWSKADLQKREASQIALSIKRSNADFIVDNSGELAEAAAQLERSLETVLKKN